MDELRPGLDEVLVTEGLQSRLDELAERFPSRRRGLRAAEAPDRIPLLDALRRHCQDAGAPVHGAGPAEAVLRRAVGRLLHLDDQERIQTYRRLLVEPATPPGCGAGGAGAATPPHARRSGRGPGQHQGHHAPGGRRHPLGPPPGPRRARRAAGRLDGRVDHLHVPLGTHPEAPLQVHARYSRIEILAALGVGTGAKVAAWQSGVYEAKEADAELLAFTLDKTSGGFSPTTRYRDYAISRTLVHWESQSTTRAEGPTGRRYQHHERDGRAILLFTRLHADDRAFWCLGPATSRGHVGERPMAITWELHHAPPATSTPPSPPPWRDAALALGGDP